MKFTSGIWLAIFWQIRANQPIFFVFAKMDETLQKVWPSWKTKIGFCVVSKLESNHKLSCFLPSLSLKISVPNVSKHWIEKKIPFESFEKKVILTKNLKLIFLHKGYNINILTWNSVNPKAKVKTGINVTKSSSNLQKNTKRHNPYKQTSLWNWYLIMVNYIVGKNWQCRKATKNIKFRKRCRFDMCVSREWIPNKWQRKLVINQSEDYFF